MPTEAFVIARKIQNVARKSSSPTSLADLGIVNVVGGRFNESIEILEEAAARSPGDAKLLNDLAVAYLARAEQGESFDNIRALSLLDRAIGVDARLPEVHFNRALALQRLSLLSEAVAAWKEFIEIETEYDWRKEGLYHLKSADRAIHPDRLRLDELLALALEQGDHAQIRSLVTRFPQLMRRLGEEEKLANWAQAYMDGDKVRAEREIQAARLVGWDLLELSGDRFLLDTVSAIDASAQSRTLILAKAHADYAIGRKLFSQGDYARAKLHFSEGLRALSQAQSPFKLRAEYSIGSCEHYLSLRDQALRRLGRIAKQAEVSGYFSLLGEVLWMKGLAHFASQDADAAHASYLHALGIFRRTREKENIAGAHILLGELLDRQGSVGQAWRHRLEALRMIQHISDNKRLYQIYSTCAMAAGKAGELRIALYFQQEAVRAARSLPNPLALAQAAFWRSKYQEDLGHLDAALAGVQESKAALLGLPDGPVKRRTEAEVLLVEAKAIMATSPEEAARLLTRALDYYKEGEHQTHLIEMLTCRASALQVMGDLGAAEADIKFAIMQMEAWRQRLQLPDDRISFFKDARRLFEAMILLQVEGRRDPRTAFEYMDRERARTLLESFGLQARTTYLLTQVPSSTVLISYAVIGSRVFAFVVDQHGVLLGEAISADWEGVSGQITAFRAAVEGHAPDAELSRLSGTLYGMLMKPLMRIIPDGAHLVFSGDKEIQRVPFSALKNVKTGRYLVQDYSVSVAPSAHSYLACLHRYRSLAKTKAKSVLVVDNPLFPRTLYGDLRTLKEEEVEARQISLLYSRSLLLRGRDASVEAFLQNLRKADIVHFRGHARVDWSDSTNSFLLFASAGQPGSERLNARKISLQALDKPRLIILAGCNTADGEVSTSEGAETLSRAFLAAGVPSVVGSSWEIQDRATMSFMRELHGRLSEGLGPVEALRATQIRFIADPRASFSSLRFWAAFQVMGGSI